MRTEIIEILQKAYPEHCLKHIDTADEILRLFSGRFSTEDMIKAFNAGRKHIYECEANGKDKKCYCRNDNDCNHRHYISAEEWLKNYRDLALRKTDVVERSEHFCECDGTQDLIAGTGECRKCGGQCTY